MTFSTKYRSNILSALWYKYIYEHNLIISVLEAQKDSVDLDMT